jgi:hypothetical protein
MIWWITVGQDNAENYNHWVDNLKTKDLLNKVRIKVRGPEKMPNDTASIGQKWVFIKLIKFFIPPKNASGTQKN